MRLFKMKNWVLQVDEQTWALEPFKKLLDRDKTKEKEKALKDMLVIYYYCDIVSDYDYITNLEDRIAEIKKDLMLPEKWVIDPVLQVAMDFYIERSTSIIGNLYKGASKSANDIANHLSKTEALLSERDDKDKPVYTINSITSALKQVPGIMRDLKAAEKEIIKEKNEVEGKKKGSRTMGMFEDGLE